MTTVWARARRFARTRPAWVRSRPARVSAYLGFAYGQPPPEPWHVLEEAPARELGRLLWSDALGQVHASPADGPDPHSCLTRVDSFWREAAVADVLLQALRASQEQHVEGTVPWTGAVPWSGAPDLVGASGTTGTAKRGFLLTAPYGQEATLATLLRTRRVPLAVWLLIARTAAETLDRLAGAGRYHGGLSPTSVLCHEDGPLLTGHSLIVPMMRARDKAALRGGAGPWPGDREHGRKYMAPELGHGRGWRPGAVDVYALGVILNLAVESPDADHPAALSKLARRCQHRRPRRRPSAAKAAAALARIRESAGITEAEEREAWRAFTGAADRGTRPGGPGITGDAQGGPGAGGAARPPAPEAAQDGATLPFDDTALPGGAEESTPTPAPTPSPEDGPADTGTGTVGDTETVTGADAGPVTPSPDPAVASAMSDPVSPSATATDAAATDASPATGPATAGPAQPSVPAPRTPHSTAPPPAHDVPEDPATWPLRGFAQAGSAWSPQEDASGGRTAPEEEADLRAPEQAQPEARAQPQAAAEAETAAQPQAQPQPQPQAAATAAAAEAEEAAAAQPAAGPGGPASSPDADADPGAFADRGSGRVLAAPGPPESYAAAATPAQAGGDGTAHPTAWTRALPFLPDAPLSALGDVLYVAGTDGERGAVAALDRRDGSVRWIKETGAPCRTRPLVTAEGVYVAEQDGRLSLRNPDSGEPVESWDLRDRPAAGPVGAGGRVWVGGVSGRLSVLRRGDRRVTRLRPPGAIDVLAGTPVPMPDGGVCLPLRSGLHRLDADGASLWANEEPGDLTGFGVTAYEDALFVATPGGALFRVDAAGGRTRWSEWCGGRPAPAAPVVVAGTVCVALARGGLIGLDARTGVPRWTYDRGARSAGHPAAGDGTVLAAGRDRRLHCVDASTGRGLWTCRTGGRVGRGGPLHLGGRIHLGTSDCHVYAVRAPDGGTAYTGALEIHPHIDATLATLLRDM